MAGGGAKRGSASSSAVAATSAYVYYTTTALLVALCVAGAYFLTSISSATANANNQAAATTVTTYRHTTCSFVYKVTREKRTAPAPPRGAEAWDRDTPAVAKAVAAEEEPRPDYTSAVASSSGRLSWAVLLLPRQ